MSDHENRDIESVALQLSRAFDAFNKSADKLSVAYKQLLEKGSDQKLHVPAAMPYSRSLNLLKDRDLLLGTLESISGGLIVVDHECRAVFLNSEAKKIAASGSCYAAGGFYPDIFKEAMKTATSRRHRKTLSEDVELEIYATPIANDDGNVIGAAAFITSISGNPETHRSQPSTIAPVFTAIGDIIINIAHQMRSPLSAIQLFAELLKQDLDAGKHETINDILVGVHSLDAVLSNLLSFSQPVTPDFQDVDLIAILDESLLFAEHAMRQQKIALVKEYSHSEICCRGDLEQLKQLFFNLILNAIQAMPEGGELRVAVSYNHKSSEYSSIKIADNGSGIPDEAMDRIFIPFFTTKEGCTGLGLCIVYRVIQAHNGSIQINSNFGYGTTATIRLPINHLHGSI